MSTVAFSARPAKETVRYVLMRLRQHWPKLVSTSDTPEGEAEFTYKALHLPTTFRVYSEDLVHESYGLSHGLDIVVTDETLTIEPFDFAQGKLYAGAPRDLNPDHPAVVAALFLHNDPIWRTDFGTESAG